MGIKLTGELIFTDGEDEITVSSYDLGVESSSPDQVTVNTTYYKELFKGVVNSDETGRSYEIELWASQDSWNVVKIITEPKIQRDTGSRLNNESEEGVIEIQEDSLEAEFDGIPLSEMVD